MWVLFCERLNLGQGFVMSDIIEIQNWYISLVSRPEHIYYTISSNYNHCGGGRSTVPELVILSYLSIMQPRTQGISTILDRFLDEKPWV